MKSDIQPILAQSLYHGPSTVCRAAALSLSLARSERSERSSETESINVSHKICRCHGAVQEKMSFLKVQGKISHKTSNNAFSNLSYDLFFLTFTGTPLSLPYGGPLIDSVSLLRSLRSLRARLSDEAAARHMYSKLHVYGKRGIFLPWMCTSKTVFSSFTIICGLTVHMSGGSFIAQSRAERAE